MTTTAQPETQARPPRGPDAAYGGAGRSGPPPRYGGASGSAASLDRAPRTISLIGLVLAVVAAVVVAGAVYSVSRRLPKSYQASATFRVTVLNQQGVNDTVVTAANDLATQYVQLANSQPVLDAAAKTLHSPASTLNGEISASTVSAQNLVQVTASASDPALATARAHAALTAMVTYIQRINVKQSAMYVHQVLAALTPINKLIKQLTGQLNENATSQRSRGTTSQQSGGTTSQQSANPALLSSLLIQRQQVLQSLATETAAGQPSLQVVSPGGAASVSYPKPTLYALIALVVALLVGLRLVFVLGGRHGAAKMATVER